MLSKKLISSIKLVVFDFDGVFTDNTVYVDENGIEMVRCSRSDGLGLQRLSSLGIQSLIVSTEKNAVVSRRANKLKIMCRQGVGDKSAELLQLCKNNNINLDSVMFVGNDINDIPALKIVGAPVGVADSHPEILPYIFYRTLKPGGLGAVREICDLIYNSRVAQQ
jgi:3-deoxy-D-manno-octulosonate 8-phosphate phosphatase (KDO 8-P phosphatase)